MMKEPTNSHILNAVLGLSGEVRELNRRMGKVESRLGNVEGELHALSKAFDSDAVRLIRHERRIKALELKVA